MNAQTQVVSFHGSNLITVNIKDAAYVAMRPIVEALGLSWASQRVKLKKYQQKHGCVDIDTPTGSGIQSMLFIPLRKLNGWLFSINPEKVRSDLKDKVIQYQEECFEVLHDYWTKGYAIKPIKTTTYQRTPLRDAVNLLVGKKGLMYPEAYSVIHQRFNVKHIDELSADQVPMAIEYVHKLTLEAEWLPDQKKSLVDKQPEISLTNLDTLITYMSWIRGWWERFEPAVRGFNPRVAASAHDYFNDGYFVACGLAHQLKLEIPNRNFIRNFPWDKDHREQREYYLANKK